MANTSAAAAAVTASGPTPSPVDIATFRYMMRMRGWMRFPAIVAPDLLGELRRDLATLYEERRAIQLRNGVGAGTEGTAHHLVGQRTSIERFLALRPLHDCIADHLGGPYILNSCGGFLNIPGKPSYVAKVHRDVRTFSADFKLLINMLVLLDDFTLENGATYLLSGSHHCPEKPPEDLFVACAERGTGRAGDIILFDSLLWHCAGENRSGKHRRALTLTFSRPLMKPQIDFVRVLTPEVAAGLDPHLRQILGFNARVPASLDEYYRPPAERAYQPDQG